MAVHVLKHTDFAELDELSVNIQVTTEIVKKEESLEIESILDLL